jgi:hypothetical protein
MHHLRRCRMISSRLREIAMRRMAVSAALRCEPAWQHGAARPCPFVGGLGVQQGIAVCRPLQLLRGLGGQEFRFGQPGLEDRARKRFRCDEPLGQWGPGFVSHAQGRDEASRFSAFLRLRAVTVISIRNYRDMTSSLSVPAKSQLTSYAKCLYRQLLICLTLRARAEEETYPGRGGDPGVVRRTFPTHRGIRSSGKKSSSL